MAFVPCPSCGLPRTAADADAVACPACGWRVGDPLAPAEPDPIPAAPVEPPPPELPSESEHRGSRWVVTALAAVGLAVLILMLVWPTGEPASTPPDELSPAEEATVPPPAPAAASPVPPPPPAPHEPPDPVVVTVPVPVPLPVTGPAVLRVDRPGELFTLDRLGAGNHVKLVGRAQRLIVDGLDGGAVLDATELVVKAASIGPIGGGSTLRLKLTGDVTFRGKIDGGSRVTVDAPGGYVTTTSGGKFGTGVAGGSRLTVTARTVSLGGPVTGRGTVVELTLTPPARLIFAAAEDGAVLRYRAEHRADPPPRVTAGKVSGGAEVKEEPVP